MLPTFKSLSVRPWWTHMHQHLMICQPPLAWTNFTCERLSASRHHQDLMWCDKDKHNTAVSLSLIVYCCSVLLISSLAGIGLRSGTCVPSKTNTGAGLICWMISNPAAALKARGREGDEATDGWNHGFFYSYVSTFLHWTIELYILLTIRHVDKIRYLNKQAKLLVAAFWIQCYEG